MKPDQLERAQELAHKLVLAMRDAYDDAEKHGTKTEALLCADLIAPANEVEGRITRVLNAILADQEEVTPNERN